MIPLWSGLGAPQAERDCFHNQQAASKSQGRGLFFIRSKTCQPVIFVFFPAKNG